MITEAIVSILSATFLGFVSLLPRYSFDAGAIFANAGDVGGFAGGLNGFAPIADLGLALVLLVGLKLALMTWNFALFVYHQFWGAS